MTQLRRIKLKKNIKEIRSKVLGGLAITKQEMHVVELQQQCLEMQLEHTLADLIDQAEMLVQMVSTDDYPDIMVYLVNKLHQQAFKSVALDVDLADCRFISEYTHVEGGDDEQVA